VLHLRLCTFRIVNRFALKCSPALLDKQAGPSNTPDQDVFATCCDTAMFLYFVKHVLCLIVEFVEYVHTNHNIAISGKIISPSEKSQTGDVTIWRRTRANVQAGTPGNKHGFAHVWTATATTHVP
jgi:hypothetical protein